MTDEHQPLAVIATAILDSFRDHPDFKLGRGAGQNNCEAYRYGTRRCGTSDHANRSKLIFTRSCQERVISALLNYTRSHFASLPDLSWREAQERAANLSPGN